MEDITKRAPARNNFLLACSHCGTSARSAIRDREWWAAEAARTGTDWLGLVAPRSREWLPESLSRSPTRTRKAQRQWSILQILEKEFLDDGRYRQLCGCLYQGGCRACDLREAARADKRCHHQPRRPNAAAVRTTTQPRGQEVPHPGQTAREGGRSRQGRTGGREAARTTLGGDASGRPGGCCQVVCRDRGADPASRRNGAAPCLRGRSVDRAKLDPRTRGHRRTSLRKRGRDIAHRLLALSYNIIGNCHRSVIEARRAGNENPISLDDG